MKRHFPDSIVYILTFSIIAIVMFYTVKYGSPSFIGESISKAVLLDSIKNNQKTVKTVVNHSFCEDYLLISLAAIYISKEYNIKKYYKPFDDPIHLTKNNEYNLSKYYNSDWEGNAIYLFLELKCTNEYFFKIIETKDIENNTLKIY